ncbi:MAG: FxLD family lanthipeptide [Actinomycetota bacterium]|nr:FxLD family lanthipeptide [Actinomycetota bacterium]
MITTLDDFDLDVTIATDLGTSDPAAPCATDDGCGHTCASACTSNV